MSGSFDVGDWAVVNYHQRYEPEQIIKIVSEHRLDGSVGPLYRIDFGRFTLHLPGPRGVPGPPPLDPVQWSYMIAYEPCWPTRHEARSVHLQ